MARQKPGACRYTLRKGEITADAVLSNSSSQANKIPVGVNAKAGVPKTSPKK